ncbi:hypothetical protein Tdes44962_MAKER00307 [Teratosphaeria destructans]|uniref:Uncharacterized protein n=1 Tax=Teratosphaeria destructans TaxID=418781 RepID=A0A9W7SV77_9PEZI|nr:hypothetical protein Tdes44962_MAKER00307 [Teratosphaeria destructans]
MNVDQALQAARLMKQLMGAGSSSPGGLSSLLLLLALQKRFVHPVGIGGLQQYASMASAGYRRICGICAGNGAVWAPPWAINYGGYASCPVCFGTGLST